MERRHPYKKFIIEAQPHKLRDLPGWSVEFFVEAHDGSGVTVTHFYFDKPQSFESEEAAIQAALAAGKRKIDAGFTPKVDEAVTV
jgi:hypothetical protein